jgi:hypothetical protein
MFFILGSRAPPSQILCQGKFVPVKGKKVYGGSGIISPPIHNLSFRLGKWSASRSGSFIPWEEAPDTYRIGCWVGLRARLDALDKDV